MKSEMRLIKSALEYQPIETLKSVPAGVRGIYSLYEKRDGFFDLVYIGMSGREQSGRIRSRLYQHSRSKSKSMSWTHYSYYEVWDNISDTEIREMEGLFRQLYRFDERANRLNRQLTHKPLIAVRKRTERELQVPPMSKRRLGIR